MGLISRDAKLLRIKDNPLLPEEVFAQNIEEKDNIYGVNFGENFNFTLSYSRVTYKDILPSPSYIQLVYVDLFNKEERKIQLNGGTQICLYNGKFISVARLSLASSLLYFNAETKTFHPVTTLELSYCRKPMDLSYITTFEKNYIANGLVIGND